MLKRYRFMSSTVVRIAANNEPDMTWVRGAKSHYLDNTNMFVLDDNGLWYVYSIRRSPLIRPTPTAKVRFTQEQLGCDTLPAFDPS
jgi:hypothetical protein